MKRWIIVLCAFAAACGSDKKKPNEQHPDETLTLSVDSPALSIVTGGSQTTTLHMVRSETVAGTTVTLAATGVPSGVTLAFDSSSTIADAVGVTITASSAASVGDSTITITGTDGELTATAAIALSIVAPANITVHGKLLSPGGDVTDATELHVYSHGNDTPQVVITNPDGSFTVADVLPPYDITASPYTPDVVHLFLGLTRDDPIIALTNDINRTPSFALDLTVTVTSTGTITADTRHFLEVQCPHASGFAFTLGAGSLVLQNMRGTMSGTETCTLRAIEFKAKADGLPTAFGYAETTTTLTPGSSNNVALAITSYTGQGTSVDLSATTHTASAATDVAVLWDVSRFASDVIGSSTTVTLPMDAAKAAAASGINLTLRAHAAEGNTDVDCYKQMTFDVSQSIQCPAPAVILTPTSGATGLDGHTTVSVTPVPNATYRYELSVNSGMSWYITTSATSITPATDLARFGLTLTTNGQFYGISTYVYDNVPSVDAWAAGYGVTGYLESTDGAGLRRTLIVCTTAGP